MSKPAKFETNFAGNDIIQTQNFPVRDYLGCQYRKFCFAAIDYKTIVKYSLYGFSNDLLEAEYLRCRIPALPKQAKIFLKKYRERQTVLF